MPPPPVTAPTLEVLLGELAHELRNPMVTIKTFAQHLDSVLADPETRARFAALTGDAITRMDTLLETVLDFARFRAPTFRRIDLTPVLERVLRDRSAALEQKGVRVERNGSRPTLVEADETQMTFALRSLIDGLLPDLVPKQPLRVRVSETGALELGVRAERTVAQRLAAYVEERAGAPPAETPPLAFALAAALIRRNGGSLEVRSAGEGSSIISLRLRGAGEG
jgi:nitrogen-specific signal transduction histidine kinase